MKFSVQFPTDRVDLPLEFGTIEGIQECAAQAETAGFDAVYVTDHPIPTVDWMNSGGHHSLDPFVALTAVASNTTKLRLHTNILVLPYRNPFLIAKSIASLDAISGGRLIVGAAAGYLEGEFTALGVEHSQRGALTDECIQLMKRVWSESEITYDSNGIVAPGNYALPQPLQRPHPPIWIGGNSRLAIRRVANHATGWAPFPAPPSMALRAGTAPIISIENLADNIDYMNTYAASIDRNDTLDVCMVPFGWGIATNKNEDNYNPRKLIEQAKKLGEIGVTWLSISLPCESRQEYKEQLDWFGQEVIAHCQ